MNALSLVEKIACLASSDREWLEKNIDRFLTNPAKPKGCDCHVIDPRKANILVWVNKNPKGSDSLVVKIADQRFIGLPRSDKRGEKYWKVRDFYENEEKDPEIIPTSSPVQVQKSFTPEPKLEVNQPLSAASTPTDRLAKFQERQAKAQLAQKETKWIDGNEVLAQLEKEKAQRENQKQVKENANNPNQPAS